MNLVILANGSFPESEHALSILRNADKIICCDGAADTLVHYGIDPDLIVGDIDSLSSDLKKTMSNRIVHDSNQENNDLSKAFEQALTFSPSEIHILGATGKREDHTLGNISLLADYTQILQHRSKLNGKHPCTVDIITDYGRFIAICNNASISCKKGTEVSLFAFDNTLKIHTEGLQYPTDAVVFDSLWKATLNTTVSDSFSVEMNHPSSVIIFLEKI